VTNDADARGRPGLVGALRSFVRNVRGDFEALQANRAKYLRDEVSYAQLPGAVVQKIGLQMMVAVRAMHLLRDAGVPLGPQVASRLIRHLYGAEIHWNAQLAPGTNIVHGNGLVIGAAVTVGEGCILLHNVTLGAAFDPETGANVGPTLGKNVHVGPGATLLGKIHVGDGTKIMAGAVLDRSVPAGSLVAPAPSVVTARASVKAAEKPAERLAGAPSIIARS
jgi:serine O-acetyltransferase